MKKLIALIALVTLSISTFSQTKDLCARGGLNLAKHRGDVYPHNANKYGVNFGFTYDFELFNNLYFRPRLKRKYYGMPPRMCSLLHSDFDKFAHSRNAQRQACGRALR